MYTSYKKYTKFKKWIFLMCNLSFFTNENNEVKTHLGKVILQIL